MMFHSLRSRSTLPLALSLALGLAACGKVSIDPDGGISADASELDDGGVAIDAMVDAQTRGTVTVNVLGLDSRGLPVEGVTVLFYEPDGELAERIDTDAAGQASAELDRGGSITVVRLLDGATHLATVVDVAPDDVITFGRLARVLPGDVSGEPRIILPFREGASRYYAEGGCAHGSAILTTFNLTVNGCPTSGDVLGVVYLVQSTEYVGQNDVDLTGDQVDFGGQQWAAMPDFDLSLTEVPAELGSLYGTRATLAPNGRLFGEFWNVDEPSAGTHAVAVRYPPGIGRGTLVTVQLGPDYYALRGKGGSTGQTIAVKLDSLPSSLSVAVGPQLLPWVEGPALEGDEVSWTADGGASQGDGVVANLTWYDGDHHGSWRFIVPPGTTSAALPALPADLDAVVQELMEGYFYGDTTVLASDTIAGWDAFRQSGEPFYFLVGEDPANLISDVPSGTVRLSRNGGAR